MRRIACALLVLAACHRGDPGPGRGGAVRPPKPPGHSNPDVPVPPPPQSFTTTDEPMIPNTAEPPVGVTWYVGFKQNVTLA